jgi:tRNA-guanine family transglycosylase
VKTFYPVMHLITGPPPLDRNGGIWKSIKTHISEVIERPNIMVQAFHFTTYNLSSKSWELWTHAGELSLSMQINEYFPKGSIFVDSGGYQFLQGDKVDLSKWKIGTDQEGIYELQRKYGADKICNLDKPVGLYIDSTKFKETVEENIGNIKKMVDIIKEDGSKIYFVVHGRDRKEIQYFFNKVVKTVDVLDDRFNFALGSQVPLFSVSKKLIIDNANYLIRLVNENFGNQKEVHIFGVGSNIIRYVEDLVNISYDNSTFVRNAMYHRWYDRAKESFERFSPTVLDSCECVACSLLRDIGAEDMITILSGGKSESGKTKSDVMGLIALHNIYSEKFRVATATYSSSVFPKLYIEPKLHKGTNYVFPLRKFKPTTDKLIILECSSKKPYSESRTHKKIKYGIKYEFGLEEFVDYNVITMSGLYGPVHWADERRPEIISYDFRLTNATSASHISNLRATTATVMSVVAKKYQNSYSIMNGIYDRTFSPILMNLGVKTFHDVNDLDV